MRFRNFFQNSDFGVFLIKTFRSGFGLRALHKKPQSNYESSDGLNPTKRRRRLTLPLDPSSPWIKQQNTADQSTSNLIAKLPLELRLLIFSFVISGQDEDCVFHIHSYDNKVSSWQCNKSIRNTPPEHIRSPSYQYDIILSGRITPARHACSLHLDCICRPLVLPFSLLVSCRQMYVISCSLKRLSNKFWQLYRNYFSCLYRVTLLLSESH